MRKKALLVGARASFEGPWVALEEGSWVVEPDPPLGVRIMFEDGFDEVIPKVMVESGFVYQGPCKLQAVVSEDYDGPEVCLSVREVEE